MCCSKAAACLDGLDSLTAGSPARWLRIMPDDGCKARGVFARYLSAIVPADCRLSSHTICTIHASTALPPLLNTLDHPFIASRTSSTPHSVTFTPDHIAIAEYVLQPTRGHPVGDVEVGVGLFDGGDVNWRLWVSVGVLQRMGWSVSIRVMAPSLGTGYALLDSIAVESKAIVDKTASLPKVSPVATEVDRNDAVLGKDAALEQLQWLNARDHSTFARYSRLVTDSLEKLQSALARRRILVPCLSSAAFGGVPNFAITLKSDAFVLPLTPITYFYEQKHDRFYRSSSPLATLVPFSSSKLSFDPASGDTTTARIERACAITNLLAVKPTSHLISTNDAGRYLLYTYVRLHHITLLPAPTAVALTPLLLTPAVFPMLDILDRFAEIGGDGLVAYLNEVCVRANSLYYVMRVKGMKGDQSGARMRVWERTKEVVGRGCELLGIDLVEDM